MEILRSFFWFCSGANTAILKRCPTEASKYVGIGGTILFTGLFAGISASYALYTVFRVEWIAIAFGMFWGAMIFNLDRFIVSSMKKRNGFFREAGMALPRLGLAILLALVISKPLELKIFEREILRIIDLQKAEQAFNSKVAVFQNFPEIEEAQGQIDRLQQEIREKEAFRNQKQQEYDLERFGVQSSATSGVPGIGRNARMKEQQLADAQKDLEQTRARNLASIDLLNSRIRQLYEQREQDFDNQRETIETYDGFAARIDALSVLTQQSRAVYLANLFIILLFIAVETAPIFVKLISPRGPYDDLLEKHEHVFSKQRIREVTKLEQETYENLHILEERSKSNIRKELDVSRNTLREMTDAEIEIARKTIQHWKEMELSKIPEAVLEAGVESPISANGNSEIGEINPDSEILNDDYLQNDVTKAPGGDQNLHENDDADDHSKR
jgi:hypothetical protein